MLVWKGGDGMADKIILADGNSLMYRAFFAVKLMNNDEGVYTNALHVFLSMLLSAFEAEKPRYCAVAFDVHAPTFRDALNKALAGQVAPDGDGDGGALPADLREVVRQAAAAYEAYQAAWAAGRYEDAATQLRRFERIMARAEELADQSG
mgnify:CR=1 FL=1